MPVTCNKLSVFTAVCVASSPGHSQILSRSCGEFLHGCEIKSGSGLGTRLQFVLIKTIQHRQPPNLLDGHTFRPSHPLYFMQDFCYMVLCCGKLHSQAWPGNEATCVICVPCGYIFVSPRALTARPSCQVLCLLPGHIHI